MSASSRPSRRGLLALAAMSVPLSALSMPLVVMIPEYYASTLGLNLAVIGVIFTSVRILDIIVDPLLGAAMDGTRTRWGRYKPWLVAGAPILMIATWMLFMAQKGVGPAYLTVALVAAFVMWSVLSLAQLALAAGMSQNYDERSKVYGWLQGGSLLGIVLVSLFPIALQKIGHAGGNNTQLMGWVIIALALPAVAAAVLGVPERPSPEAHKAIGLKQYLAVVARPTVGRIAIIDILFGLGFGVASAALVFFFTVVKDLPREAIGILMISQMATAMVAMPAITALSKRLDKHVALGLAGLLAAVVSVIFLALPKGNLPLAMLLMIVWGFSYAAFTLLPRSMMADASDSLRLDTGADQTGVLFALLISSWKLGGALSVGLVFIGLDMVGYQAALMQNNTPSALMGLQLLFAGPSALLFVIGAWLAFTYPLTRERHAEIRARLDAKGLAAAPAQPDRTPGLEEGLENA